MRELDREMKGQNGQKLLALRAHTVSVTRGEILAAVLLEPELLHFTVRFRPLFLNLFQAYSDWPSDVVGKAQVDDDDDEGAQDRDLGHMSFAAFFRVCIDFGIYPDH